jgi:hypothetical protein
VGHDRQSTLQLVDHSLRGIRFEPRPSLEAELLWRVRRDRPGTDDECSGAEVGTLLILSALAAGMLVFLLWVELLTFTR